jgi:hypothetical protein
VYDITVRQSFLHINKWIKDVQTKSNHLNLCMILVANKIDRNAERVVSAEEGAQLAAQNEIDFFQVSAKTGQNVSQAFDHLVSLCAVCNFVLQFSLLLCKINTFLPLIHTEKRPKPRIQSPPQQRRKTYHVLLIHDINFINPFQKQKNRSQKKERWPKYVWLSLTLFPQNHNTYDHVLLKIT